MNIGNMQTNSAGIGTYNSYRTAGADITEQFYSNISSAAEISDAKGTGEVLGITTIPYGNTNISYGMTARYSECSTPENPIIQITSNYGGEKRIYDVKVNEVNPRNASQLEMFALMTYQDDQGITERGTFGSYARMKAYSHNAEMNGYCEGIYDYNSFMNDKKDWIAIIQQMMSDYMNIPQTYEQGLACQKLIAGMEKQYNKVESEAVDYKQILSEKRNEIYEKLKNGDTEPSYQIGNSSFTEKEWDKLLEEVDDITEEMREAMREEHQKRFAKSLDEERVESVDRINDVDISALFYDRTDTELKVSDFKEFETEKYKFVPEPEIGGLRILVNGQSVGVFSVDDLKIRVDEQTGTRVLISEMGGFGGAWYDAIPVDAELESGLEQAIGVEDIPEVALEGYYIGTHSGTGIQYVMRQGDEGRGGKVLLRNEVDVAKYNALAEEYYNRYPNLINSQEEGRIWASLEIVGMAERTDTGIVRIGYDGVSYDDNSDYKKNWSIMFTESTWELLSEWLKENREHMKELEKFSSWRDVFDEIGGSYDRIWSDEELKQGYLNN